MRHVLCGRSLDSYSRLPVACIYWLIPATGWGILHHGDMLCLGHGWRQWGIGSRQSFNIRVQRVKASARALARGIRFDPTGR